MIILDIKEPSTEAVFVIYFFVNFILISILASLNLLPAWFYWSWFIVSLISIWGCWIRISYKKSENKLSVYEGGKKK